MDIESMARYWSQDAENYGDIIRKELASFRVEAETEPDNAASQRVLAKCGFVPNGIVGEEGPRYVRR